MEKAAAADPSAGLELDLATAVFQTNGAADGLRQLERVPGSRRGAEYRLARAQMLNASGKTDDAIAEMNRAIEASPKAPHLYWQAAILLFRNERGADALQLLSKVGQTMPQERQFPVIHAILLELSGQTEEAMRELDTVQRRWPEFPASWVARGMIDAAHEHCLEASQSLSTAVSLGAHSPEVLGHLADCILRSAPARTEEAESAIQRALRFTPNDPWLQGLAAQIRKESVKPAKPAEGGSTPPDPRRLFQSRPPGEW